MLIERGKEHPDKSFYDYAIKYLQKILALRPLSKDSAIFRFYLGVIYLEKGEKEKAKTEWELTLQLDPDYQEAKVNLNLLEHRQINQPK